MVVNQELQLEVVEVLNKSCKGRFLSISKEQESIDQFLSTVCVNQKEPFSRSCFDKNKPRKRFIEFTWESEHVIICSVFPLFLQMSISINCIISEQSLAV